MPTDSIVVRPLVEAACLAHVVGGVALRLRTVTGRDLLVSYGCLGADIDPCQLRAALVHAADDPTGTLWGSVVSAELIGGVHHLGGGLYERTAAGADAETERWFVTGVALDDLRALVAEPLPMPAQRDTSNDTSNTCEPDDGLAVTLKPDPELGVVAVCVHATNPVALGHLDEVASAILARALVAELLASRSVSRSHSHPAARPPIQHPRRTTS